MAEKTDYLDRAQKIASIASYIAIPIVIAFVGWWVQSSISSEGLRKDYVQMALAILKDGSQTKDGDLREWAVAVLEKNSPVPFGPSLRAKIFKGGDGFPWFPYPTPPAILMEPPLKLKQLPEKSEVTNADLLRTTVENYGICHQNAATLEALQEWARQMQSIGSIYKPALFKKADGNLKPAEKR